MSKLTAKPWQTHAPTSLMADDGQVAECSGFGATPTEAVENARRLVACWNAFEGVPIENIERVGKAFAGHLNAVVLWNAARDAGVFR